MILNIYLYVYVSSRQCSSLTLEPVLELAQ